jgi:hypothetical protein
LTTVLRQLQKLYGSYRNSPGNHDAEPPSIVVNGKTGLMADVAVGNFLRLTQMYDGILTGFL